MQSLRAVILELENYTDMEGIATPSPEAMQSLIELRNCAMH